MTNQTFNHILSDIDPEMTERLTINKRNLFRQAAIRLGALASVPLVEPAEVPRCPQCGGTRRVRCELAGVVEPAAESAPVNTS